MTKRPTPFALLATAVLSLASCSDASSSTGAPPPANQAEHAHDEHGDDDRAHDEHEEASDHDGHDAHQNDVDGHGHEEEGEDHVELNASEAEEAGIQVSEAELGQIAGQLELPAEIRFDADRVARVSPQVEGIVSRFYAGEGDTVAAGASLALLSSRELAGLKADYLSALSAERLARADQDREERLWEQQITSEADLQAARASFAAAHAAREAAENRLHAIGVGHDVLDSLDGAEDGSFAQAYVRAPISGKVIQRNASIGETVAAGASPIFVLIDDSVVWADIAVYKEDLAKVDAGLPVRLLSSTGAVLANGSIATILPVIDETSRTATARVIVDNPDRALKPGQFVTASIETRTDRSVVRVPSNAIVSVEQRASIFVPTADGFAPRPVQVGASASGFTEIISGLSVGDVFVSHGAFTLKAQLEKDAFGDGHVH